MDKAIRDLAALTADAGDTASFLPRSMRSCSFATALDASCRNSKRKA